MKLVNNLLPDGLDRSFGNLLTGVSDVDRDLLVVRFRYNPLNKPHKCRNQRVEEQNSNHIENRMKHGHSQDGILRKHRQAENDPRQQGQQKKDKQGRRHRKDHLTDSRLSFRWYASSEE